MSHKLISDINAQPYKGQRCSDRLENALDHVRRRNIPTKSATGRSLNFETPYTLYNSFYGQNGDMDDEEDFYNIRGGGGGGYYNGRGYYAKNINRDREAFSSNVHYDDYIKPYNTHRQPHKLNVNRVDVEELRVRMPQHAAARWVEVDKCKFSTENSTLDTRLVFPDLTISGKIVLQPSGGKCNMILRLRHAGIEFKTTPIGFEHNYHEQSRRMSAAAVRTDSHFAEPGFISVFAHGCQGPSGIALRQNSKRRYGFGDDKPHEADIHLTEPQIFLGNSNSNRLGKLQQLHSFDPNHPNYDIRSDYRQTNVRDQQEQLDWLNSNVEDDSQEFFDANADNFYRKKFRRRRNAYNRRDGHSLNAPLNDEVNFQDDILNVAEDLNDLVQPDARAFAEIFSSKSNRDDIGDALTNELERLFSMGVRGLLTTYMQRALQPAIKETLMENMGYTLSYG